MCTAEIATTFVANPVAGLQAGAAYAGKKAYDLYSDLKKGPPTPQAPTAIPEPQTPAQVAAETQAAVSAQRQRASSYLGQQASIMTSPLGMETKAATASKKLLGN